ncbi:BZ3500_MvSof-1268-A1-R1_Chr4-2g07070 [Microbotryum saponariae]|uniref:BZ3500_MvSof-1268-A1-R1_Chr4-2g07070 protein n=1 Tax=Microbotryum saponariae TaxID=289078 RepID=A0A2X0MBY7_9BASI|nr:BZ3500_MvSof-1268-A1-R1_Chr4-2g07070 [Microbotryum saponariae]SDA06735.1 BZ3501_MvSof-1269-A2-R1_Chr4-2g06781 [Microbotryum saponariae]
MILRGYETVLLLLTSSISLAHAELTPIRLTPRRSSPTTGAQVLARSLVERGTTSTTNSTNASSAVCTATQCLQGTNSLSAGVYVVSRANGTDTTLVKLLPGTYTSSSSTNANSSFLSFPSSTSASTVTPSAGFTTSGILGSTYTVSLQPGIIVYSSALFQGTPSYLALPSTNTSASNSTSTSLGSSISSLLLSNKVYAILHAGSERLVVWDGVADVSQWRSVVKNQVTFQQLQSSACATPCASGGTCTGDGRCACATGWAGTLCDICEPGHYGSACLPCPANCANCDQGVTGTGRCLDVGSSSIVQPSICNCINGICASNSSSATCACSAGWSTAANGTQCGACATGYYQTSAGDCLACDASCASCSSPSGTCLTCQSGLQPDSTDATKCITATSTSPNGTFITCAARTYYDSTSQSCVDCNPLCETCYTTGTGGCLTCRSPNGLLNGQCVAVSTKTGVCNSAQETKYKSNAVWVFDNTKQECDALPAKCSAGGIDNFSSGSLRSGVTCSTCVPGSYLYQGICYNPCPNGTAVSTDETSCVPCDSSCSTCYGSTPSACLSCANSNQVLLNGKCVSSCPQGFYTATNSTCMSCHPDCATCGSSFTTCLTCPTSRPVLSSGRCLLACSSSQYYDTSSTSCQSCSSTCGTCSGPGTSDCLSCPSGSNTVLSSGACVASPNSCQVIPGFGACLSQLVVVSAPDTAPVSSKKKLPWWWILLSLLLALFSLLGGFWWWRRKDKARRRKRTERFGLDLGHHEVKLKLQKLDPVIANPVVPKSEEEVDPVLMERVPLTPRRFDTSAYKSGKREGEAHELEGIKVHDLKELERTKDEASHHQNRWSNLSYQSAVHSTPSRPAPVPPLQPQDTGTSTYSDMSTFTTASGKKVRWGDRNPFNPHH